jgi:hypothetical protein
LRGSIAVIRLIGPALNLFTRSVKKLCRYIPISNTKHE